MLLQSVLIVLVGLVRVGSAGGNEIMEFPTASTTSYISYRPGMPTLTAYTVCAWLMDTTPEGDNNGGVLRYWFSYNVKANDNSILLGNGVTKSLVRKNEWYHYCTSWDSASPEITHSINGELVKKTNNHMKGKTVPAGGILVIGQDQDTLGGGFDARQSFVGKLYDINLWDYVLTQDEVASLYEQKPGDCGLGTTKNEPIISYTDLLAQTLHGAASVIDESCSGGSGEDVKCYDSNGEEFSGGQSFTAVREAKPKNTHYILKG